jgi:hypothetical protein
MAARGSTPPTRTVHQFGGHLAYTDPDINVVATNQLTICSLGGGSVRYVRALLLGRIHEFAPIEVFL